jgi:hypothetical protein
MEFSFGEMLNYCNGDCYRPIISDTILDK